MGLSGVTEPFQQAHLLARLYRLLCQWLGEQPDGNRHYGTGRDQRLRQLHREPVSLAS